MTATRREKKALIDDEARALIVEQGAGAISFARTRALEFQLYKIAYPALS